MQAAEKLRITSRELVKLNVADGIIPVTISTSSLFVLASFVALV